jgi:hypothetical protein
VNENAVFAAIRELVAAGGYLDNIPGIAASSTIGSGHYLRTADGQFRRIYHRGSPGYLQACRAGLAERLPALPVAAAEAVEEA